MNRDFAARLEPHAAMLRSVVVPLALVAAGCFAYRMLFEYAPYTGIEGVGDETESIFFSPNESSPLLIFLVTGWLVLGRRWQIQNALGAAPATAAAGFFLLLSSAFYLWAWYTSASDLSVVSLIFAVLGAGALLGGRPGLRAVWLPAVFMLMLVPVPAVLINEVVFSLQLATAHATAAVLEFVGIPSLELGDLMYTRGRVFQVIESCAGLRMIDTLTMSAVLYIELFYRSRLQSVLLLISAPLLGIFVNQVRVLSIVLSPQSSLADGHTAQGIVMVVAGVLLIAALDALLTRLLPEPPPRPTMIPKPPHRSAASLGARTLAICGLLIVLGLTPLWLTPWNWQGATGRPLFEFKPMIDGRTTKELPIDKQFYGTTGFSQVVHRRYASEGEEVDLFLASDDRLRRRVSMISDKTAWPGSGYRRLEKSQMLIREDGRDIEVSVLDSPDGPVVVFHWYEGVEPLAVETLRSFLALDQSPLRRPGRGVVVRLSTPAAASRHGMGQAEARLRDFLPIALSELDRLRELPPASPRRPSPPRV